MSQGLSLGHGRFRSVMVRRSMAGTQRIRVLVVDDHQMFTHALTAVLEQDGRFEVVGTAATGREAVRLAKTANAEVVLMDMSMPVLDGPAATRRLRRTRACSVRDRAQRSHRRALPRGRARGGRVRLRDEVRGVRRARRRRSSRRTAASSARAPSYPPPAGPPSTSGLGHHPFKVAARVRIPLGASGPAQPSGIGLVARVRRARGAAKARAVQTPVGTSESGSNVAQLPARRTYPRPAWRNVNGRAISDR